MRYALNIGTRTSKRFGIGYPHELSIGRVNHALVFNGFECRSLSWHNMHKAEGTIVLTVDNIDPLGKVAVVDRLFLASEELEQDCIAVVPLAYRVTEGDLSPWHPCWEHAALVGPYKEDWGSFDRNQFTLPQL